MMSKSNKIKITDWDKLSDEEILRMRIRDLNIQIESSPLDECVKQLYSELDSKGISFHPPCYLSDEWHCPDKIPIIGIPFCLAHPRLKQIEEKIMYEVEGGTRRSCMKYLRHECGHALNYAYKLYLRTRWRQLFGAFSTRYPGSYYYQPYSKRCVVHLENHYAQSHPDEDFAETFAVWLAPDSNWNQKYRTWPVIKKLKYVDNLMKKICEKRPVVTVKGKQPWSASRMISTLAAYYDRKRRELGTEFQGYYDDSLKNLFTDKCGSEKKAKASRLIRTRRYDIIDSVTRWTGHRKYDICQLVNRLIQRCEALDLYVKSKQEENIISLTSMITSIASDTHRINKRNKS